MMTRKTVRRNLLLFVTALAVMFGVALVAAQAFAADVEPDPIGDLWVTFGGVTIAWASAQMGLLQVLKAVRIGDKPLLGSPGLVWLANGVLGVVGMTLAATQAGIPTLAAVIQAIIAVFAASGEYEFMAQTGKKAPAPTGSE